MLCQMLLRSLTLLFAICAVNFSAAADGFVRELKIGVLAHDVPDLWSGFRRENDAVAINAEAIFAPSISLLGGFIHPALGGAIATEGGTSNVYLDARWIFETDSRLFFSVGLGAAIHDGQTRLKDPDLKVLGSRALFHIPAEIGYRFDDHNSVSLYFEHMSNGYTAKVNEGLDRLGIRYGYRF